MLLFKRKSRSTISTLFSEFIRNGSSAEKKRVYKQVLEKAPESGINLPRFSLRSIRVTLLDSLMPGNDDRQLGASTWLVMTTRTSNAIRYQLHT